jgi:hypothetical protein
MQCSGSGLFSAVLGSKFGATNTKYGCEFRIVQFLVENPPVLTRSVADIAELLAAGVTGPLT